MILTIILGYGVFTEENIQYRNYLDSCINLIKETYTTHVITTGGFTNHVTPDISEAASVKKYIERNLSSGITLIVEEKSLTTLENIELSKSLLQEKKLTPEKIYISCDSIRAPKVFYLAFSLLNELFSIHLSEEQIYMLLSEELVRTNTKLLDNIQLKSEYITIEGIALGRSIDEIAEQIPASMLEIAFMKYPLIHKHFIALRKERLKIN